MGGVFRRLGAMLVLGCGPAIVDDPEPTAGSEGSSRTDSTGGAGSGTSTGGEASVDVGPNSTAGPDTGIDTSETSSGTGLKLDLGVPSPIYGPCASTAECEPGLECAVILAPAGAWSMCTVPCDDPEMCPRPSDLLGATCEHDPSIENFYCVLTCEDDAPCPDGTSCIENDFQAPACIPD